MRIASPAISGSAPIKGIGIGIGITTMPTTVSTQPRASMKYLSKGAPTQCAPLIHGGAMRRSQQCPAKSPRDHGNWSHGPASHSRLLRNQFGIKCPAGNEYLRDLLRKHVFSTKKSRVA